MSEFEPGEFPRTVTHAATEIDTIGAAVFRDLLAGRIPRKLNVALGHCFKAYGKVQHAALLAHAADHEAWGRQWNRKEPPTAAEDIGELPLWYLARILAAVRQLRRTDAGGAWDMGPADWDRVGSAMRFAAAAIAGASIEARVTATERIREDRKVLRKVAGPTLVPVPLHGVPPLSA